MTNTSDTPIVKTNFDARRFMETLVNRTVLYLSEEADINVQNVEYNFDGVQKLDLKELTSIITVEDSAKMTLAFSYEDRLIREIYAKYTDGLEIEESETEQYIGETAGDMINIILGNILSEFQQPGRAFALSTPIIVNKAKSIASYKKNDIYEAELKTSQGNLVIFCITPGETIRRLIVTNQGGVDHEES